MSVPELLPSENAEETVVVLLPNAAPVPVPGESWLEAEPDPEPDSGLGPRGKRWTWGFRVAHRRIATAPLVAIAALLIIAGLALWSVLYLLALSGVQEHRTQHVLASQLNGELALQTSPVGGVIKEGAAIARMSIPRLGIRNLVIVEGTSAGDLQAGPGHRRDSVLPGEEGVSFLFGRASAFGGPFAGIDRLKKGDPVTVETGEGIFTFTVDGVRRPGDPQHLVPAGAARLTLVSSVARGSSRQAVFVDATTAKNVQTASTGRPTRLAAAEGYLRGDDRALPALAVWLLLLAAAGAGLAWAFRRWDPRPALLVAVPVLAAILWGVSTTATRLLPNLL